MGKVGWLGRGGEGGWEGFGMEIKGGCEGWLGRGWLEELVSEGWKIFFIKFFTKLEALGTI